MDAHMNEPLTPEEALAGALLDGLLGPGDGPLVIGNDVNDARLVIAELAKRGYVLVPAEGLDVERLIEAENRWREYIAARPTEMFNTRQLCEFIAREYAALAPEPKPETPA